MPTLGNSRRIRWSDARAAGDGSPLDADDGIVMGLHANPLDACHWVLEIDVAGKRKHLSIVIRDEPFRDRVVALLRERGVGRRVSEVRSWNTPE